MKRLTCLLFSLLLLATLFGSLSLSVFAASTDVLKNKTVYFCGDDTTSGFAKALEKAFPGDEYTFISGAPSSGVTISDWRKSGSGLIHKQILAILPKNVDYVILHGGLADMELRNDGSGDTTAGVVTGAINPHDFSLPVDEVAAKNADAMTFAAGVERYIKYAITKLDGKRIGFLINYATPFNKVENARDAGRYWDIVRAACEKWNVPYLDLYAGKASDGRLYSKDILDLYNKTSPNIGGSAMKKLTDTGYATIAPYIAEWIASLPAYNLKATMATAPTTTTGTGKTLPTTTTTTTNKKPTTTIATAENDKSDNTTTTTKNKYNIVVQGGGETVTRPATTTAAVTTEATKASGVIAFISSGTAGAWANHWSCFDHCCSCDFYYPVHY